MAGAFTMRSKVVLTTKFCFLFFLTLPLCGCGETASESGSEAIPSGERISVTEAEIVDAMKKDDLARFFGKQLELKGVVGALGADGGGNMILEEVRLNTVENEPWTKVMPNQEVTLVGTYTEERGLKFAIESVTGDRIVMEAPELATEFVADKEAANTKYKEKWMELRGTVAKTETLDADIIRLSLKAENDNVVECSFFPEGQEEQVKKLKEGDQVKLVGRYATQTSFDAPILNACLLITE
jgi:hypothetical protein